MAVIRHLQHPGPVVQHTATALPSRVQLLTSTLRVGETLLDAVTQLLSQLKSDSAVLRLTGGVLSDFCYYLPALSDHPEHAVFFSDKVVSSDPVELELATLTFGERDGAPWLHCHAVWRGPDGVTRCGHLVPDEVRIAQPVRAEVCLIESVRFQVGFDPETNFSLFQPQVILNPSAVDWPSSKVHDALVIRAIPNQDLCETLEDLCAEHGWAQAEVHGGVGSLICADFADGRHVDKLATELLIERGRVTTNSQGQRRADIDVALVDDEGTVNKGRIARQQNPVLVTCELVLVASSST